LRKSCGAPKRMGGGKMPEGCNLRGGQTTQKGSERSLKEVQRKDRVRTCASRSEIEGEAHK